MLWLAVRKCVYYPRMTSFQTWRRLVKSHDSVCSGHTTGSAYICGEDTLGMKPETKDETYPLFGKVSMPRIIVAQFDSINHTKLLSKYGHRVLRSLESFIFRNQSTFWWTIYLCVFILLHEASWLSADRYRHARHNFGGRVSRQGSSALRMAG